MTLLFWAIGIALVFLIFLFVKVRYVKHKLAWVLILTLIAVVYLTFMISTYGKNINLNTAEGLKTAGNVYMGWIGNGFQNMKLLTSHAVRMDWNINATGIR